MDDALTYDPSRRYTPAEIAQRRQAFDAAVGADAAARGVAVERAVQGLSPEAAPVVLPDIVVRTPPWPLIVAVAAFLLWSWMEDRRR